MPLSELSVSTQNYLKTIWSLEEWTEAPATASALAERMGLRVSSVSDGLKRLAAADLIDHQRYGAIELTPLGRTYAVAMIRRHRLIETFLVETLGYTWDRVHDEAEVLEHAVSDFMIERIDAILDHPTRDPHGDPIPDASGRISFPTHRSRLPSASPASAWFWSGSPIPTRSCCAICRITVLFPGRVYFLKRAPPFRRRLTCGFSRTPIIPMRLPLKTRIRALYP